MSIPSKQLGLGLELLEQQVVDLKHVGTDRLGTKVELRSLENQFLDINLKILGPWFWQLGKGVPRIGKGGEIPLLGAGNGQRNLGYWLTGILTWSLRVLESKQGNLDWLWKVNWGNNCYLKSRSSCVGRIQFQRLLLHHSIFFSGVFRQVLKLKYCMNMIDREGSWQVVRGLVPLGDGL